jgi:hypothetical protein
VQGQGSASELRLLGQLWQGRVRTLLLDFADDAGVFDVRLVERRGARAAPSRAQQGREAVRP